MLLKLSGTLDKPYWNSKLISQFPDAINWEWISPDWHNAFKILRRFLFQLSQKISDYKTKIYQVILKQKKI